MKTNTKFAFLCSITTALLTTTAHAGGLDRAKFSPSILFKDGLHAEIAFARSMPDVRPAASGNVYNTADTNVASDTNTMTIGAKTDFANGISFAVMYNNNPYGVTVDYSGLDVPTIPGLPADKRNLRSLNADIQSDKISLMLGYQIDQFTVYGGGNRTTFKGSTNLTVPIGAAIEAKDITTLTGANLQNRAGVLKLDSTDIWTPFLGVAYEVPDIALRVALTYELGGDAKPDVKSLDSTVAVAPGSIGVPDAINLDFQTGIAKDTLLFGRIRSADWADAQVSLSSSFDNYQVSDFDDSIDYTLGVARKFSDKFSGLVSLYYDPSDGDDASLLSPRGSTTALTIAGNYAITDSTKIAASATYSRYGTATYEGASDKTSDDDLVFSGGNTTTLGIKLEQSF